MALLATSADAGGPAPPHRRLARALTWPLRALGRLALRPLRLVTSLWSWSARARRYLAAPLAVALFAFSVLGPPGPPFSGMPPAIETALLAAQLLPIAVAPSRPVPAALVMASANALGLFVLDYYPVQSIMALVGVIVVVARSVDRATAAQVGAFSTFALVPMLWHPSFQPVVLMWWAGAIVAGLTLGDLARSRQEAEAGRDAAQQQQVVLEERSRIARELHDVVAHHMSLIAVQSQSAPRRIADLPPEGVADFEEINAAARKALAEMRRVLAVLRADHDAERAPQPGVDALATLIAEAEQSGQHVGLRIAGRPRPLRDALDVSVYRIVQEALTNVRRHAGVDAADVTISYQDDAVRVRVTDQGGGDRSTGGHGGHGLVGMRERVAMLGGELTTGDGDGGGFVVDALMPYDGTPDVGTSGGAPDRGSADGAAGRPALGGGGTAAADGAAGAS